jgi:hypothetical protein
MDPLIRVLADQAGWFAALLAVLGLLLIVRFGPPLVRRRPATPKSVIQRLAAAPIIPPGVLLKAQPLLTQAEAALYNLTRLAVQEQFLVFAQVPVWCLVDVWAGDRAARSAFLNQIAFKRVEFVLIHPGTLCIAKIVELDDPGDISPQKQARDRLLNTIFQRARIPVVRLSSTEEYSVAALAGLLGVEPSEDDA